MSDLVNVASQPGIDYADDVTDYRLSVEDDMKQCLMVGMQYACEAIHNNYKVDYTKVFTGAMSNLNDNLLTNNSLSLKYATKFYLKDFIPLSLEFIPDVLKHVGSYYYTINKKPNLRLTLFSPKKNRTIVHNIYDILHRTIIFENDDFVDYMIGIKDGLESIIQYAQSDILNLDCKLFCNVVKILRSVKNKNLFIESKRFIKYQFEMYTLNMLIARLTSFDLIDKKDCEEIVLSYGNQPTQLEKKYGESNNYLPILHIELYLEYLDNIKRIDDSIRDVIIPKEIKCVNDFLPVELVRIVEFYFAQIY
jgi:hypothetical protein